MAAEEAQLNADAESGAGAVFHPRDEMHGGFPS